MSLGALITETRAMLPLQWQLMIVMERDGGVTCAVQDNDGTDYVCCYKPTPYEAVVSAAAELEARLSAHFTRLDREIEAIYPKD